MATTAKLEVHNGDLLQSVQAFLHMLMDEGGIAGLLTPLHLAPGVVMPALVTEPERLKQADPLAPAFPLNSARIAAKLTRGGSPGGPLAAVLRPCEVRAFVELVKLNQGNLEDLAIISLDCLGAYSNADFRKFAAGREALAATGQFTTQMLAGRTPDPAELSLAKACRACEHPVANNADITLGMVGLRGADHLLVSAHTPRGEALLAKLRLPDTVEPTARKNALAELVAGRVAFRNEMFAATREATASMPKLAEYLAACVGCYNCRAACPVCYCRECVFLTDVFDHKPWQYLGWAKGKSALRMPTDTVLFHLTRLAHMSLSCVGCGQCSNACPNDVPVMELFRSVAARTQEAFAYEPGRSPDEPVPLSVFQAKEFAEVTGGRD
jgi:formate dehydrogenase subunit beta